MTKPEDPNQGQTAVALECPTCPLCGGAEARLALEGKDDWIPNGAARGLRFGVLRCIGCGARYTSPRFPEAAKALAFAGEYPFYLRARRTAVPLSKADMSAFDRRVEDVLRAHPAPGRVLDIGMGDGAFLSSMRSHGWEVAGLDVEPSVVAYARSQLGITDCSVADVERDPLPQGPFDAITLWGMFQLAYRPQALLEKLRPALAPGGVLALGLSNIDSLGARLFRSRWRGLGLPRHLVHYDAALLKGLLGRAGYRTLSLRYETPAWIVNGSLEATRHLPWPLGQAARVSTRLALGWLGRGPMGDTITLLAAPCDR